MKRQIIAVDIDDVLFPYVLEVVEHYNMSKGGKLSIDDFHTYHFMEVWGGNEDEATEIAHGIHRRDFLHTLPVVGAKAALAELAKRYELHIVTSRPAIFEQKTKEWVEKYFPGIFMRVDVVGNHYDGSATHSKVEVCQELGSSYLIDDQPKYIQECADKGMRGILFGDYGWNRNAQLPLGVTRGKDWAAVLEYFDGRS
jgi:5'(3')-deoxyribonucleotidase